uniref:Phospholipid scramblase n=1 Tax=Macrostomum lignano TaxID=282301 RepID=A0A1I8FEG7_9PLAT
MEQFGQLLSNWESGAAFAGSVRPQLERLFPLSGATCCCACGRSCPTETAGPSKISFVIGLGQTRTLAAVRSTNLPPGGVTCTGSDHCSHRVGGTSGPGLTAVL